MEEVLQYLNIDERIIFLSSGKLDFLDKYSVKEYYGAISSENKTDFPYPPFFIPILINYNATPVSDGIIKHWFTKRNTSFGYMDFGTSFDVSEFAFTPEQFLEVVTYDEINIRDLSITDNFKSVLESINIDYKYILKLVEQNKGHTSLKSYNTSKGLMEFYEGIKSTQYTGNFPTSRDIIIEKNLENACFYEISHKEWIGYPTKNKGFSFFKKPSKYSPVANIPEWLSPDKNKKELFEKYVSEKNFDKAWLTINGPEFSPKEVGERMQILKRFTNERGFHLWTDFWCKKYGHMDSFIFI